ncbi:MAG: N-acetylmuramoyl-L-alanine amidase [Gammaproteobacteria bacterium]
MKQLQIGLRNCIAIAVCDLRTTRRWQVGVTSTVLLTLSACGSLPMVDVPAEVHSSRVDHLVIHFTGGDFAESMGLLTQRTNVPVSTHYLVPESDDPTYPRRRLQIHQLVDEERRAWHAGESYWHGDTSLNARSIGIEIVNQAHCIDIDPDLHPRTPENQQCVFPPFDTEQTALVIELARDILARYPDLDPEDIVGHSDIAPGRRLDPGPMFPWRELHENGIGAWYDDATAEKYLKEFNVRPPDLVQLQHALSAYGYQIEPTGLNDPQTRFVLRAFQSHYRPSNWSGKADAETAAILFALIEKYRPDALEDLYSIRQL